jgi:hypothetical protein
LSVDEAAAGAASAASGWHYPALAASALALRRSAGTGRSVGFFEAKNPDIAEVAVMKFRHWVKEVLGVPQLIKVHRV